MVSAAEEEGGGWRGSHNRAGPQCCQNIWHAAGVCVCVHEGGKVNERETTVGHIAC